MRNVLWINVSRETLAALRKHGAALLLYFGGEVIFTRSERLCIQMEPPDGVTPQCDQHHQKNEHNQMLQPDHFPKTDDLFLRLLGFFGVGIAATGQDRRLVVSAPVEVHTAAYHASRCALASPSGSWVHLSGRWRLSVG